MLHRHRDKISRVDNDIWHDSDSSRVDLNLFRKKSVFFIKNLQKIGLSDLILIENLANVLTAYRTVAFALHKPIITLVHFERHR